MCVDAEEIKKDLMTQNQMSGGMFKMDNDPRTKPTRLSGFAQGFVPIISYNYGHGDKQRVKDCHAAQKDRHRSEEHTSELQSPS